MSTTIYAYEFQVMIGDVQDYLDISERTIVRQHRLELRAVRQRCNAGDSADFPSYREHLEANAEHRFKVSLPLRIRYGVLLALVTAVEWSVKHIWQNVSGLSDKKGEKAESVWKLEALTRCAGLERGSVIRDFETLAFVRNCIAHNAGLEQGYKYEESLRNEISRLKGISIAEWHFLGSHVVIEKGALDPYIEGMKCLVVDLQEKLHEKGLLK